MCVMRYALCWFDIEAGRQACMLVKLDVSPWISTWCTSRNSAHNMAYRFEHAATSGILLGICA